MIVENRERDFAPGNPPLLLSVPEAARLLGVGTTFCWEMVRSGRLEVIRLGRRVLVPRGAVEKIARVEKE